ncbi:Bzip transcription factor [Phytophthora cinnamomi]|uniref:Bzip transcription factor n=1 Tax=Phytophthora cinnamomi TaxID=4785 RepID=UPI00355A428D|nr:Bzip transcription factor [Phytophthora cinnamomi]
MEIARLLDASSIDNNTCKHLLSPHKTKQSQLVVATCFPERKRRRRPSAQQIRDKNQRDAGNSLILNLTLDVNDLRQQVHDCVVEKSIRETRMLVAREQFNARSLQTVEHFFHLFEDGYPEAFPARDQRFLSELLDDNISFGGGVRGQAQFFEQWHRYKKLFLVRHLRFCSAQIITSDTSGCLIECLGEFEGRVTAAALETVFPHVLCDRALVERVLSRSFVCPTRTLINLDRSGHVVQYDAFSDVFEAMSTLLDFNPLRVVKMMDNAIISEEGSMLPPCDDDVAPCCSYMYRGGQLSPSSGSSLPRNSIDFILS